MDNAVNGVSVPKKHKERNKYPDRLKVTVEALDRLSKWDAQISEQLVSVKLTRSDLVNFLILDHAEILSVSELENLERMYFDELKFAKWAYKELKEALDRGEATTLEKIIELRKSSIPTKPRPKKHKSGNLENTKKVDKNPEKQPLFTEKDSSKSLVKDEE